MTAYIIIVNENSIKIDFSEFPFNEDDQLILIASFRCIEGMSPISLLRINQVIEVASFSFEFILEIFQTKLLALRKMPMKIITNDECVDILCAKIREYLGLEGARLTDVIHLIDKGEAKTKLMRAGIRVPAFIKFEPTLYALSKENYVNEVLSKMSFPLVAKPTDQTSSSGVVIIYNIKELLSWCDAHVLQLNYEIEEYIDGVLYHCDCIIQEGKIIYTQMGEGTFPCHEIVNGKNIGTCLVPHDTQVYFEISNFAHRALSILNPPDGTTHMEIFHTSNGNLIFLEMSARPPGGDIRWMYQVYDNIDIEKAHFLIRMGFPYQHQPKKSGLYPAFALFPTRNGTVKSLNKPDFSSDYDINWNIHVGQQLSNPEDLAVKKAGTIRLYGKKNKVKEDFIKLRNFIPFELSL